ncbi:MAG TPA: mechanosensitive ion channel [bacterium (Candidatus Stahlbacteria)]|nr:mechanosensitive ion channel [Candidatus Stahlbacteria bacterium]
MSLPLASLIKILVTIGCGVVAAFLLRLVLKKFRARFEDEDPRTVSELERRAETMVRGFRIIGDIIVTTVVVVIVLKEIGIEIGPIIATMGIIGFAVGFGAQSLIKDLLSGFFLIIEDQIRIGDVVTIGKATGKVERITIKTTRLRGKDGELYIIPNGDIGQVVNYSRRISQLVIEITAPVDPERMLGEIGGVIKKIYNDEVKKRLTDPIHVSGIKSYRGGKATVDIILTSRLRDRDRVVGLVLPVLKKELKDIDGEISFQIPDGFVL